MKWWAFYSLVERGALVDTRSLGKGGGVRLLRTEFPIQEKILQEYV